jgi:hypothetical protein
MRERAKADPYGMTNKNCRNKATAEAKYRDLSTTRRTMKLSTTPVEMTSSLT